MRAVYKQYKRILIPFIKAFLLAFALSATFQAALVVTDYETKIDYVIASIYELLGFYNFKFVLILLAGYFFFSATENRMKGQERSFRVLAFFFAGCLLLGNSYNEVGNWSYCFGSIVNVVKSILALLGYAGFFHVIMCLFANWLKNNSFVNEEKHFFTQKPFLKAFAILTGCYSIFLIISYPGNLCWDVIGQIEQVIMGTGYSTHHPLAHTLIVGGFVELGKNLFGSYEIGLFLYMWFQMLLFTAALSVTVKVLADRKVKKGVLITLLMLYIATPIYTNLVTTALKDVPFTAFVIVYVVCFALLLENPELYKSKKFVVLFVLIQIGVILFRNNGFPIVLICGVGGFLFSRKRYHAKEKLKNIFVFFGAGLILGVLLQNLLAGMCDATSGSKGEILSIPFQQTARYLQVYRAEIGEEERAAIEAVLGDVDNIAANYDPDISDPVKALYQKDTSMEEVINYFGAWMKGLVKHPAVYVEAFLVHIHGWFTPSISNAIRYETSYDVIGQGGLFPNAEKIMIFLYRFANRFPLLGILENIGMAVWALFFMTCFNMKYKHKALVVSSLPLWVSLLVCMASPCFWGHPRYALPILATLPFLYGFMLCRSEMKKNEDESHAKSL